MEGKQLCESPAHPEPGCLSKKSLRDFSPSCFQNCKMKFCSIILQFCRCGGLLNAKGNPDGFLSHFSSLRNLRLGRFFDSLSQPAWRSRTAMQADNFCRIDFMAQGCQLRIAGERTAEPGDALVVCTSHRQMANAPELSLRGGRRPTWRPEREARGSALGVQSCSTRPHRGKAIGEIVTAFPRLPRRFAPRNDTSGGAAVHQRPCAVE